MHPLDGPSFKIGRALKHLRELDTVLKPFIQNDFYEIVRDDNPGQIDDGFLLSVRPMPTEVGAIIGDIVQDLRAALDYIVWELSLLTNSKLREQDEAARRIEFPIFDDPLKYAAGAKRRLTFVPKAAWEVIENLQPYPGRDRQLLAIEQLARYSRHREITPIIPRLGIKVLPNGPEIHWKRLDERDYRVRFVRPLDKNLEIEVSGEIILDPATGVDASIHSLFMLWRYVWSQVLPKFTRFFPEIPESLRRGEPPEPHLLEFRIGSS